MLPRTLPLVFVLLAFAAAPALASQPYIVVLEPGVESVDRETGRLSRSAGFSARLRFKHALKGFSARLDAEQVRELRADPDVAAVVADRKVHARGTVALAAGEPLPPTGTRRIEAASASVVRPAAAAAVAVLDTGIDLDHPDLNAGSGTNCIRPGQLAEDDHGHGTHVAGIVGARNNGSGTVGVAPGTRVYSVKVLDATGEGAWSQVICGLDWVTANATRLGIRVANLSLGAPTNERTSCSDADPLHAAICRTTAAGVLAVAAAGNEGVDFGATNDAPSSYPEVLAVTGMADLDGHPGGMASGSCGQLDDTALSFSSYATKAADLAHTLAAPGSCIVSTRMGGGVVAMSGTSMSTPHVAAAAALCAGEGAEAGPCAAMTPAQVIGHLIAQAKAKLEATAGAYGFRGDPMSPLRSGRRYGYLVHAAPAAAPAPGPTPSPSPSPTPSAGTTPEPMPEPTPSPTPEATMPSAAPEAPADPTVTEPAAAVPDTQLTTPAILAPALGLSVRIPRRSRGRVISRGVTAWVTCSERCLISSNLLTGARVARAVRSRALPQRRVKIVLRLSATTRRAVLRGRRLTLRVRATGVGVTRATVERRVRF